MNKILKFLTDRNFRFNILAARGYFNWMSDKLFLKIKYRLSTGRKLNITQPQTYNEKLQWLKLYNRKPEYTQMVDKYEAKKYVANIIGEEYIIPTLGVWDRFEDIDFDALPNQFVLKCTHDSGGLIICRDKAKLNIESAKKKINKCLNNNYFWSNREWPYKNVKPRIIAEEYITTNNISKSGNDATVNVDVLQQKYGLLDYKFMCFDGVVKCLFLDIGVIGNSSEHSSQYYRSIYDKNFNVMSFKETRKHYPFSIEKPHFWDEMLSIAERISKGIPHLRVDLYYVNGHIKVGELTFFHGSGLTNNFQPEEWDYTFGSWIKLPFNTISDE